ncbi:MAG: hypothetical protein ISS92_01290 [Candidatus Omnitrophica bacterium]|nr:hypothetical protein [Candidatus Omnitrophota bacterium]
MIIEIEGGDFMANAKKVKEILATTENKVGKLAEFSSVITGAGVNITAVSAYGMEGKAHFMAVTSDNAKAIKALSGKGYEVKEEDVVELQLENKVGALEAMGKKLAGANIDLNYIYGSVSDGSSAIILSSNNNDKAIGVLG